MADGKIISTGRGGAGNARTTSQVDVPETDRLPKLKGKRFTTGRGGKGNMMSNVDADSSRAAQDEFDEDAPFARMSPLAPATTSQTIGRGGFGNNLRTIKSNGSYKQDAQKEADGNGTDICSKISSIFSS